MLAFDLRTAEQITEEHDMPNAFIKALGEPVTIGEIEVATLIGYDEGEQFLVTACKSDKGITTSHYEMAEVLETGKGDFLDGALELMRQDAADPLPERPFSD